ncbi:MAG: prephenate dehydratase [Selenomonadaceae bacterium]|nr:prephenate dehydratase [Selenomonadaceae bacterium]
METIGILGPRGTHSEEAALWLKKFLRADWHLEICADIYEVLNAVKTRQLDGGIVPVENSLEGSINITLDTLARSDTLTVTRELVWSVRNFLMTRPNTDVKTISKIFSHAQPLSQCRKYLQKNFPQAETVATSSTARAAEIVKDSDENFAAVCTERAGRLNGLSVAAANIQDNKNNSTRFFEIRYRPLDAAPITKFDGDKVLIICQIDGSRAGSLCEVLEEFSKRGVNMTRIESRPARTILGAYIFFFDLETDSGDIVMQEAIQAVYDKSIWLKNLGVFSVIVADAK